MDEAKQSRKRNIAGVKKHHLTALTYIGTKGKKSLWSFKCDCGKTIVLTVGEFNRGRTKSCGCKKAEACGNAARKHGMSSTRIYAVYRSMVQRCTSMTSQAWADYGGRGIKVCDRWLQGFEKFYEDMGPKYRAGLSLDRIDNNKGYSPENCRWVDTKTQCRNRRSNVFIDTPWGTVTVAEAAEHSGISESVLQYRLNSNAPADLLFAAVDTRNRFKNPDDQLRITFKK